MSSPFKSKVAVNIATTEGAATIVTDTVAASTTHTIVGLSLANTTTSNITVNVFLSKGGSTNAYMVKGATVLPGGSLVVVGGDQKVVIEPTDSIKAYSSAASSCDVITSYLF